MVSVIPGKSNKSAEDRRPWIFVKVEKRNGEYGAVMARGTAHDVKVVKDHNQRCHDGVSPKFGAAAAKIVEHDGRFLSLENIERAVAQSLLDANSKKELERAKTAVTAAKVKTMGAVFAGSNF